jgi:small subunit ribosomal protein S6
MRAYELMYILDPTLDEDGTQALMGQIDDFMRKQGVTVEKTEPWGKRRLAYQIGKHGEGFYVLSHFQAGSGVVAELERRLRVTDGVMRFITVRVDEEQEKLERKQAKRKIPVTAGPEEPAPVGVEPAAKQEGSEVAQAEAAEPTKAQAEAAPPDASAEDSPADDEPTGEAKKEDTEAAGEAS